VTAAELVPVRSRTLAAVPLLATLALIGTPFARAATGHPFTATYRGTGSGDVNGTTASGSATASGRGQLIGAGLLTGSATGRFTSPTCVVFSGTAVLKGTAGSIRVAARNAQACADTADANSVSFSGHAKVTGGTSTFAGAQGTLAFRGTYVSQTGAVTISFKGRLTY
jgi:hypothetical protein